MRFCGILLETEGEQEWYFRPKSERESEGLKIENKEHKKFVAPVIPFPNMAATEGPKNRMSLKDYCSWPRINFGCQIPFSGFIITLRFRLRDVKPQSKIRGPFDEAGRATRARALEILTSVFGEFAAEK